MLFAKRLQQKIRLIVLRIQINNKICLPLSLTKLKITKYFNRILHKILYKNQDKI